MDAKSTPASALTLSSNEIRLFVRAWMLGFLIVLFLLG
jgi:hypothetical protein